MDNESDESAEGGDAGAFQTEGSASRVGPARGDDGGLLGDIDEATLIPLQKAEVERQILVRDMQKTVQTISGRMGKLQTVGDKARAASVRRQQTQVAKSEADLVALRTAAEAEASLVPEDEYTTGLPTDAATAATAKVEAAAAAAAAEALRTGA